MPANSGIVSTRALEGTAREVRYSRFRVTVTSGPDAGRTVLSTQSELSAGTAEGNGLVLSDTSVSRHHCSFLALGGGVALRDLRSTNGTWLGDVRVEAVVLPPSASIRIGKSELRLEVLEELVREPLSEEHRFGAALGTSPAMRRIFALLPKLAQSDATVLLEGETGTGKGLIADAIHRAGPRADGPFVVVDCSSIPPSLIESELFGHERGSYTGATSSRCGAFEAAKGGTVFLDEIGELPLDMQPKLLRALEERVIKRIGSVEPVRLDVRVVAATNRDLRQEVNRGGFRADLYYRLNIVSLRIPPLRERREDVPHLIGHFHAQFTGAPVAEPPVALVTAFCRREWPGNVRELRSAVERAVLLGDGENLKEAPAQPAPTPALPAAFDASTPFRIQKERAVAAWERWYLQELIAREGDNVSRAARAARMDRNYLTELLRRHGLAASDE